MLETQFPLLFLLKVPAMINLSLHSSISFQYCGLNPAGYNGGLYRGSVPTNAIARIDLSDNKRSWRNLGVGLTGGAGYSMAWRGGDLFVGGTFGSAGGRISTAGIARWRGDHWVDVVARCRGLCDRAVDVLPYISTTQSPASNSRKPGQCFNLRNYGGRIYCIDISANQLAWFDSNTWHQAGSYTVPTPSGFQNSVISRNGTNGAYISVSSVGSVGANGANYATFDSNNLQFTPSNGGFSQIPLAMADGSFIRPSVIVAIIVLIFSFLF